MESYICEIQHHSVMNCVWLKLGLLNRNKHHPLPSTTHTIFLWLAFSPHDDVLDRSWNETRENFAAKLINFISIQSHGFPLRPSAPTNLNPSCSIGIGRLPAHLQLRFRSLSVAHSSTKSTAKRRPWGDTISNDCTPCPRRPSFVAYH